MTKSLSRISGMIALMMLASSGAFAQAPNYSYIEGGYLNVDPDNFDDGGNAWYGEGSIGFFKNFHVYGRYISGDYVEDVDLGLWKFGAGWHGLLGEKADLVADVTWTDQEIEDFSDDGVGVTAGVRWRIIKWFELDGFIHWVDFGEAGSTDSYEVRGIFDIWRIGIGAAATLSDDDNRYNAFVRFNFGKE